ncbi:MAG: alpha/beta hydrolase [Puniceicoccales bacterium]
MTPHPNPDKREASPPRNAPAKSLRRLLTCEIFPSPFRTHNPVLRALQTVVVFFLVFVLVLYACMALFALFFAHGMIFRPPAPTYQADAPGVFMLSLANGNRIAARFYPNPQADKFLIVSHGNGEDMGSDLELPERLREMGFNVVVYDYPGYGASDGRPSEQGCYEAIETVYDWLLKEQGATPEQIVLFGRSLGGGPTVELATRKPVAGVILDGTFTSTFRVMTRVRLLPWDCFNNLAKIDSIGCPLLILHGTADRTVPFWHGEALFAQASQPKTRLWVEGAGHINLIEVAAKRYSDAVINFRESLNHE